MNLLVYEEVVLKRNGRIHLRRDTASSDKYITFITLVYCIRVLKQNIYVFLRIIIVPKCYCAETIFIYVCPTVVVA